MGKTTEYRRIGYICLIMFGLILFVAWSLYGAQITSSSAACPGAIGNTVTMASVTTKASWLLIQAPSTNAASVYLGGANVTTSNGLIIVPGASLNFPTQGNAGVYDLSKIEMICGNNTDSVRIMFGQ